VDCRGAATYGGGGGVASDVVVDVMADAVTDDAVPDDAVPDDAVTDAVADAVADAVSGGAEDGSTGEGSSIPWEQQVVFGSSTYDAAADLSDHDHDYAHDYAHDYDRDHDHGYGGMAMAYKDRRSVKAAGR
jgi:hypothetical protein